MLTTINVASLIAILTQFHIVDEFVETVRYILDCGIGYHDIDCLGPWGIPHTCTSLCLIVKNVNGKALVTGFHLDAYKARITYVKSDGVESASITGEDEQARELLIGFLRNWTTYNGQLRHYVYELAEKQDTLCA